MESEKKKPDYKDTLNLPKTDFSMRAGLLTKEPQVQARWQAEDLYGAIRRERAGAERFVLHDGPPYANGNIHMGTALNKVLKDMVERIQTMSGRDAPYVPGWDCHGLPIEHKVMTDLGKAAAGLSPTEIRKRSSDYAREYVGVQSEQFRRLGVMGRFEEPYLTMNPGYEAATLEVFARLVEENLVYRQLKPVHWSLENRTALAEAELEYEDRDDPSVYVLFEVVGEAPGVPVAEGAPLNLMIWTTTPWTLPANRAVAVHPEFDYAAVRANGPNGPITFLVAADLETSVLAMVAAEEGALRNPERVGVIRGSDLLAANLKYRHPLEDSTCPVVDADYVTLEQGTGLVHTAPGHGAEDYLTGIRLGIEVYCPVRGDGTYDDTVAENLRGLSVWEANPKVVATLVESGHMARHAVVRHSYPHDWRSKGPTIFRATEQWFVAVDRPRKSDGKGLRDSALAATGESSEDIRFVPGWGRARMRGMLESRPDWCISRQRFWGLPIPVFFNSNEESLLTPATVRAVAAVFAEKGSDAWFELGAAELLVGYDPAQDPHVVDASKFSVADLTPGRDIFDVWFESGSSWFAVAVEQGLVDDIPVDLYLEGSDQHRGWFQLSLLCGLGDRGRSPFHDVVTHGFIVTEDGHKMSKSLGNTIDVIDQLGKRGADILRLWLSSQDFHNDIRCSEALIGQSEDAYRKIRNTLRFLMGGCFDFDPAKHSLEAEPGSLDHWFRMELHRMVQDVRGHFDEYEFHKATRRIYEFSTVQASSIYLSAVKDRLYCDAADSPRRRSAQTVMHETLVMLIKLLAPMIPHTVDEAWNHVPSRPAGEPAEIHLALLPEPNAAVLAQADDAGPEGKTLADLDETLAANHRWVWERLLELRSEGLIKQEAVRNAGVKKPLDTEAVITVDPSRPLLETLLRSRLGEIEDLLGVGFARLETGAGAAVTVEVIDARETYPSCERSWKRRPDVGSDPAHPALSARDAQVVTSVRGS